VDSSFGKNFRITVSGESHGKAVGVVIDSPPAGLKLEPAYIQELLDRRIPPDPDLVSARREPDEVEIISGVLDDVTTGAPVTLMVWNKDVRSKDYSQMKETVRPGHGDYPMRVKYGGYNDYRGGGRASGRMTVALIMAGAIAKKLLDQFGIEVLAHTVQIYDVQVHDNLTREQIKNNTYSNALRCADPSVIEQMRGAVRKAKEEGDSVGGIVEGIAYDVLPGLGEPFFDSLDADIAKVMFSIPAVKGVEFGSGFRAPRMRGSEHNDPYTIEDRKVVAATNNAGGILGGLSNGMPIVTRVAFKPASSIAKEQQTVNVIRGEETTISVTGRHDPCVVPKAVPVVESALAIVLADHMMRSGKVPRVLK
jgi:chorismate synthase